MNSLTFLGTGCGVPSGERFHSAMWLEQDNAVLLIDAGEPCSNRILANGLALTRPEAVLITHAHSDHLAGLPMFLQGNWLARRERPLSIFLPEALIAPLKAWLRTVYLPPESLGFDLRFVPWQISREHTAGPFAIRWTPTTHLNALCRRQDPDNPERFHSMAISVSASDRRVIFSGDLGTPEDLDPLLQTPTDVLVCELSHFPADTLFHNLSARTVHTLALVHLSPDLVGCKDSLAREAAVALPNVAQIVVPDDGDAIAF